MNDETKEQMFDNMGYPLFEKIGGRYRPISDNTKRVIVFRISVHAIRVFAKKIKEAVKAQFCEHTLETMHIEHNLLEAIDAALPPKEKV